MPDNSFYTAAQQLSANVGFVDQNGTSYPASVFGLSVNWSYVPITGPNKLQFKFATLAPTTGVSGWYYSMAFESIVQMLDYNGNMMMAFTPDPSLNPANNLMWMYCKVVDTNANVVFNPTSHQFYDVGGNLMIDGSTANALTLAHAPTITTGYFAGASVTRVAGSGDTTGTISIGNITAYSMQVTYTPGTTTTAGYQVLQLTLGTQLAFTPNPFVGQMSANGLAVAVSVNTASVNTWGCRILSANALTAGTPYIFTICILP